MREEEEEGHKVKGRGGVEVEEEEKEKKKAVKLIFCAEPYTALRHAQTKAWTWRSCLDVIDE